MTYTFSPREQGLLELLLDRLEKDRLASSAGGGLTYADKKHIVEQLDARYVDDEISSTRRALKYVPWALLIPNVVLWFVLIGFDLLTGRPPESTVMLFAGGLWLAGITAGWYLMVRGYRLRLFLLECLRALAQPNHDVAASAQTGAAAR